MGNNSITSNLSKDVVIAEIRLTLSADLSHKASIVVVEGEDDIDFFKGKLCRDVYLLESYSGKIGVAEIVNSFHDRRVIGICDIDYDLPSSCQRIFYYDYSCLEMMLISNLEAFSSLFYVYYQGPDQPEDIRYQILSDLKWLSFYRKKSSENGWAINFKGLSIDKAFDKAKKKVKLSDLLSQIMRLNPEKHTEIQAQIKDIGLICQNECNLEMLYQITQGHDFLHYFQSICNAVRNRQRKSPDNIELFHSLVCSFCNVDFAGTALYQALTIYQNENNINIVSTT